MQSWVEAHAQLEARRESADSRPGCLAAAGLACRPAAAAREVLEGRDEADEQTVLTRSQGGCRGHGPGLAMRSWAGDEHLVDGHVAVVVDGVAGVEAHLRADMPRQGQGPHRWACSTKTSCSLPGLLDPCSSSGGSYVGRAVVVWVAEEEVAKEKDA